MTAAVAERRLRVSPAFGAACIALASGALAYAAALVFLPSSFVNGHYVPVGNDSFYHARRILDAIATGSLYEFDAKIHAPEGSWITWPWAYDLALARVVGALQKLSGALDPMAILAYVPPTWAFVNAALLTGLGATLKLRLPALALLGAVFALSPLTQMLHGLGVIDHHYVEYSFVLAAALCGVRWMQAPESARRGALLGALLGAAPAFHNGLFALQIPVDLALLLLWWRGQLPPARSVRAWAGALLAVTLLVLLPSEPFRAGQFSMTTLSWFHLYAAALSAGGAAYLGWHPPSARGIALLVLLGAAALVPGLTEVVTGSRFLTADLVKLDGIAEALNLPRQLQTFGFAQVSANFSAWFVLLPFIAGACAIAALRPATAPAWRFAAVLGLFGTVLMFFQARLHYFGSAAMFLAPLLALQALASRPGARDKALAGLLGAALVAGYVPAAREVQVPVVPAWQYDGLYPVFEARVFPVLRAACAQRPGIVLAHHNDGHPIRFHTDCAVISNNFILTPQHERKLLEAERAMELDSRALVDEYPDVDYLLLHALAPPTGLTRELLYTPGPYPPQFQLLTEAFVETAQGPAILAKVFRIERGATPRPGTPAGPGHSD